MRVLEQTARFEEAVVALSGRRAVRRGAAYHAFNSALDVPQAIVANVLEKGGASTLCRRTASSARVSKAHAAYDIRRRRACSDIRVRYIASFGAARCSISPHRR